MKSRTQIIQIVLAIAIAGGIGYFYWYSRDFVAGYYELIWFSGETILTGGYTKWLFLAPPLAIASYAIYYKLRRQAK